MTTPDQTDQTDQDGAPDETEQDAARNASPGGSMRGESLRYALAALMIAGVVAYLMFGEHKGVGIFAALVAVVLTRLLVLGTGEPSREGKA
jgi:hypothetical protein